MPIRRKLIRGLAEECLERCSVSQAPIPVDRVVESYGITICRAPTDDELSGFMYRDQDSESAVIGVNADHSANRQRFTLGHELGHYLLHDQDGVHVDRGYQVKLRSSASSEGTNVEEQEANLFAAELLMPAKFLKNDLAITKPVDLEDEEVISKLAKRYKVSTQAMTFRLAFLKHIEL